MFAAVSIQNNSKLPCNSRGCFSFYDLHQKRGGCQAVRIALVVQLDYPIVSY